ncbi:hypothetical protein GCM10010106_23370 [Thermopolyspora flexuosa]|uniref:Mce-associated membrane protein n=1 Tax=Thermopolyspora flexuosa TaxID=103836 RepID=A0A543J2P0_9ACTN|nr:hypothetical protein [Thermopolyspora flexuosa]TQM77091.1 hypothetical protein FHX40_3843 [Thermopolyspora flexuosa]GGM76193.1 hypothetical protein GCM10010106_23370 [Thermopolyspora flexuosa]
MKHRGPGEPDRPHASGGRWGRRDAARGRHGRPWRPPYADEQADERPSQVGAWVPRGPGGSGPQPSRQGPWAGPGDEAADAGAGGLPGDRAAGDAAVPYPDGPPGPAPEPAELLEINPGRGDDEAAPRRGRGGALLVALPAIAAAGLAVAVTLSYLELRDLRRTEAAAAEALAKARSYAAVMLSYDHRSVEQDLARAAGHATERLAARYRRLAETLVPEAKREQAVQQVHVTGAAVESATPERVRVLMLINRTTSKLPPGAKSRRSEVVLGRVRFVMVKGGDGAWRVDELSTLLGDPPART